MSPPRSTRPLFPLVRHMSAWATPLLVRLPVSANQVTAVSLVVGLAACLFLLEGGYAWNLYGALLFVLCYLLDNCDGEIARIRNQSSEFGYKFDTFVDWVVHALFFAALGYGVAGRTGSDLWMWLGWVGAAGGTINYFLALYLDARLRLRLGGSFDSTVREKIENPNIPDTWKQWVLYAFRELTRADFCFIVLVLAVFNLTWVLLPAAAVGAHAYWLTQFARGARDYRA